MTDYSLVEVARGQTVVQRLEVANQFGSRLLGLQFRASLPAVNGLLLVPCRSVHTCFVRFPIDVVFLDRAGVVTGVRSHVKPWRVAVAPRRTYAVVEIPAGTSAVRIGQRLAVQSRRPDDPLPKSLRFLMPEPAPAPVDSSN